jgi:hypothetical protein
MRLQYKVEISSKLRAKVPGRLLRRGVSLRFPGAFALNFGAKFFFMDDPDGINTVTCPDGGNIIFKSKQKEISTRKEVKHETSCNHRRRGNQRGGGR